MDVRMADVARHPVLHVRAQAAVEGEGGLVVAGHDIDEIEAGSLRHAGSLSHRARRRSAGAPVGRSPGGLPDDSPTLIGQAPAIIAGSRPMNAHRRAAV